MGGAEVGQARGEGGLSWFARCAAVGSAVPPRPSPSLFLHFRFGGNAHDQEGESVAKESGCRGWQRSLDRFVVAAILAAVLAAWLVVEGLLSHSRGAVREERTLHGWYAVVAQGF